MEARLRNPVGTHVQVGKGVPFALETPGSRDPDDPRIAPLQKLRER